MTSNIYLLLDDETTGPYSYDELQQRLSKRSITRETLVWWEGKQEWEPLAQALPELLTEALISPQLPAQSLVVPSTSKYWGNIASSLVLPLFGLMAMPTFAYGGLLGRLGYAGLLLIGLGIYNALQAFNAGKGVVWKRVVGGIAIAASCLLGWLGLDTAFIYYSKLNVPSSQSSSFSSSAGKRTENAWRALEIALQYYATQKENADVPATTHLQAAVSSIDAIELSGVDKDLVAFIQKTRLGYAKTYGVTALIEKEALKINKDSQMSAGVLGLLFGAAGAQNHRDPYQGAMQGGAVAGQLVEFANQSAMQNLLVIFQPQLTEINSYFISLMSVELIQLQQKLQARYGLPFTFKIE